VARDLEPAAPEASEIPVQPVMAQAPTVQSANLRNCRICHEDLPETAFVGLTGQRTTATCYECVCIWRSLLFFYVAADRLLASPASCPSGSSIAGNPGAGSSRPGSRPGRSPGRTRAGRRRGYSHPTCIHSGSVSIRIPSRPSLRSWADGHSLSQMRCLALARGKDLGFPEG
jgi:hypothetical protein